MCLSFKEAMEALDLAIDETTNLIMAAPTMETCMEFDGFVCKVRLFDASCNVDNSGDDGNQDSLHINVNHAIEV